MSPWGLSQNSLRHGADGGEPGFSGLTGAQAIFAVTRGTGKEREGSRSEAQHATPDGRQKALGHCGEKATEGGKATELPDFHFHGKMRK